MPAINASRQHGLLDLPALRKRAKRLLNALNNHQAEDAREQLRTLGLPGPDYRLADTQWLVAREAGFASWPKLKAHADAVAFAARHPGFAADDEATVQHWRCGNDIAHSLRTAGFAGAFQMFDDPMVMGPVPALPEERYWRVRGDYVQQAFNLRAEDVEQRQAAQRAALAGLSTDSKLVLWCEADAYDQLFLIRVLASLPGLPRRLELIEADQVPGVERFIGIGQLAPDLLAWLWPQRRALGEDALVLARQAWAAYTAPAPHAWAELAGRPHKALPLLGRALARQLQELPGANDGLSLTERLLLGVLASRGELPAGRVFGQLMMQDDPLPYLGDLMFHVLLQPLIHAPQPLLLEGPGEAWAQRLLRLTPLAEQVLAGKAHWLDHNPAQRWVGGVLVDAADRPWVVSEQGDVWRRI
ncbi:TPA: DUF1835 domain-containing protein [Pseudomonas putida]|uniref:DUF1835 domain-containing protein n=1 Tax=Pseudomonas putida (strain GB-1) TaxID=76869 RepID=B0KHJ6_PSEPG|nr:MULTISPECIES: DUF1835 domain-containing protein [Pseudomonas]ABY99078.1 conserved hypothetical protein [Pseudomonas putida GB-1]APE99307.1 hypothetical protein BG030_15325 [Pseudomonas putida]MBP0708713.1 DUF1835 domain-containing protein [Pseudomonas sp. T34]MCE1000937.1 DUF1835 domain-containing protein [Pseudomonas sp. NMI1173_11]MCK2188151.1 DUF1835 domain-containing protein [Pseudomonas sp. MB04B]